MRRYSLVLVIGLAGCRAPVRPTAPSVDPPPALHVAAARYSLRLAGGVFRGTIPFRYTNPRGEPAAVAACSRPYAPALERWDGQGWGRAYEPVRQLCLGPPLVIAPGATVADSLRVVAGAPGTRIYPQFTTPEIPGRYQLVWWVADAAGGGEPNAVGAPRPESERVSNAFELQVEAP